MPSVSALIEQATQPQVEPSAKKPAEKFIPEYVLAFAILLDPKDPNHNAIEGDAALEILERDRTAVAYRIAVMVHKSNHRIPEYRYSVCTVGPQRDYMNASHRPIDIETNTVRTDNTAYAIRTGMDAAEDWVYNEAQVWLETQARRKAARERPNNATNGKPQETMRLGKTAKKKAKLAARAQKSAQP